MSYGILWSIPTEHALHGALWVLFYTREYAPVLRLPSGGIIGRPAGGQARLQGAGIKMYKIGYSRNRNCTDARDALESDFCALRSVVSGYGVNGNKFMFFSEYIDSGAWTSCRISVIINTYVYKL